MRTKKAKNSPTKQKPNGHAPLPAKLLERIRKYKLIFGDADPDTLEETIELFQQSKHRERKIRSWERIAEVYQSYISKRAITDPAVKEAVFYVALGGSLGKGADSYGHGNLLTKAQIEDIVSLCKPVLLEDVM
jgi:hypothetical protein